MEKKRESSITIAMIYGKDSYRAQSIRRWVMLSLKGKTIPLSLQRKHSSKSLLHDESVCMHVADYLRSNKFKKGIYVDGHEFPDICKIRTLPMLDLNQKLHILVTHDESTFYAYDGVHAFWDPQEEQSLRKKETGAGLHVSNFLIENIGRLKDDEDEA
ncbi:3671_t:CDS:2 [Cetraspora pellucida]|uniref:3671_t:CDS:1 n=1 Tax=Cetraspora pellucida TaxID=1433469 RepID=A0A9N9GK56_9GLOM|nr:3671_t:CDS:2 [Cetraspora pellucida]